MIPGIRGVRRRRWNNKCVYDYDYYYYLSSITIAAWSNDHPQSTVVAILIVSTFLLVMMTMFHLILPLLYFMRSLHSLRDGSEINTSTRITTTASTTTRTHTTTPLPPFMISRTINAVVQSSWYWKCSSISMSMIIRSIRSMSSIYIQSKAGVRKCASWPCASWTRTVNGAWGLPRLWTVRKGISYNVLSLWLLLLYQRECDEC